MVRLKRDYPPEYATLRYLACPPPAATALIPALPAVSDPIRGDSMTTVPAEPPFLSRTRPALLDAFHANAADGIARALRSIRTHLGMDIAFISEFIGDYRTFRYVDAVGEEPPLRAGMSMPMDEGYCLKVIAGLLPELIPDTGAVPAALDIPATIALPIGAHLSVPLHLADGSLYGTFCCFSARPDLSLNERDLNMMRTFSELIAYQIEHERAEAEGRREKTERIVSALDAHEPLIVFQPVVQMSDMTLIAAESLARFSGQPVRSPDYWFAEASEVGLLTQLELAAIRNALAGFRSVWDRTPLYLGLNSSPQSIVSGDIQRVLQDCPMERVVIEITEHDHIEDYASLLRALAPLRAQGVRVAVDDAGSGYASMRHILNISPDLIKLDVSLTRSIDVDRTRRALATALIEFGRQTGSKVIAEGVETAAELETLRQLGVHAAQGFYLSRPLPLAEFQTLLPS